MHNLNGTETINNKFALINSGEYLMNLNEINEIVIAAKRYLKIWKQDEIDSYNAQLLAERTNERFNTKKHRESQILRRKEREEKRFIYLILNKRNGLYKIGLSINPIKRERTLQSEEPEIEVIKTFKGGFELEKKVHSLFEDKRVRGEWFNLSKDNIETLHNLLS